MRFEPIDTWPGVLTPEHERKSRYTFRASHSDTIAMLNYELSRIEAIDPVIRIAVSPRDIRRDGVPGANARPDHPGVVVEYEHPFLKRTLRHATDQYETWHANLRAIALTLKSLRDIDRHGTTSRGEQYAGFQKLLTTGESSMNIAEAEEFIKRHGGYRRASKMLHPDTGGNEDAFKKLQQAAAVLGLSG